MIFYNRQKVTGWVLVVVSAVYLAYFFRIKVMMPGPLLSRQDWFNLITAVAVLIIGIINVRLASWGKGSTFASLSTNSGTGDSRISSVTSPIVLR